MNPRSANCSSILSSNIWLWKTRRSGYPIQAGLIPQRAGSPQTSAPGQMELHRHALRHAPFISASIRIHGRNVITQRSPCFSRQSIAPLFMGISAALSSFAACPSYLFIRRSGLPLPHQTGDHKEVRGSRLLLTRCSSSSFSPCLRSGRRRSAHSSPGSPNANKR